MNALPDTPLVSIVMPAYNAARYIRESIQSILQQTYPHFELIICDDASSDETWHILNTCQDKRIKIFRNAENQGYLKTCNFLFSQCRGSLITFQDADDISSADRLEKQIQPFLKDPELGLVTTNYVLTDEHGKPRKYRRWRIDYNALQNVVKPEFLYCGATIMIRKEVYDDIGGYREYFNRLGAEDFDWLYRIIEKYPAVHLEDVLYYYRIHPSAVKTTNLDLRKYFVHDIVHFLREQRLTTGKDDLDVGGNALDAFVNARLEQFNKDPSLVYRLEARKAVNQQMLSSGFYFAWKAIKTGPLNKENYLHALKCFYSVLLTQFRQQPS